MSAEVSTEISFSASYDPEDDKLRLRASEKFGEEMRNRLKARKFKWAPKQKLWVAHWSPAAEKLLIELAGYIGEEDTSLEERTLQRYGRFTGYLVKRTNEAVDALDRAESLVGDGVAGGATRRQVETCKSKAEVAKGRAANLWATADYWRWRSAGVVKSASYKQQPDVRHRRIKELKKSIRRCESQFEPQSELVDGDRRWYGTTGGWMTDEQAEKNRQRLTPWIEHYKMRVMFEELMLEMQDGDNQAKFNIEVGGKVLIDGGSNGVKEWLTVVRVNKGIDGINSVTTTKSQNNRWQAVPKFGIEEIKDYQPPTDEGKKVAKSKSTLPPICNYNDQPFVQAPSLYHAGKSDTFELAELTNAQFMRIGKDYRGTKVVNGTHRVRVARVDGKYKYVFLTDKPVRKPPARAQPSLNGSETVGPGTSKAVPGVMVADLARQDAIEKLRATAERVAGLQAAEVVTVVGDQLYPTPDYLAERMCGLADVREGLKIADFSAGTGSLLKAAWSYGCRDVFAMELVPQVATELGRWADRTVEKDGGVIVVRCGDFLGVEPGDANDVVPSKCDVVLLNPPFSRGDDIKHITHAAKFVAAGGCMLAICAAGSRQLKFLDEAATWYERLPSGTFKQAGTMVETALAYFKF